MKIEFKTFHFLIIIELLECYMQFSSAEGYIKWTTPPP